MNKNAESSTFDSLMTLFPELQSPNISTDFPYKSKFVNVLGSCMHYIEQGEGDPILFLHGNPTSSYLWRNVIPHLKNQGRVIAVDNIGFGKSDKPDIDFTFADHYRHVKGFIDATGLRNITLVTHEWGSALGLSYAANHPDNICGIAFMEATLPALSSFPKSKEMEDIEPILQRLRDPIEGFKLIVEENQFIETILPAAIVRSLTEEEMEVYRSPFVESRFRQPILTWPNQLPVNDQPTDMKQEMEHQAKWLLQSTVPKLHLYGSPGITNPPPLIEALKTMLKNYETVYVGKVLHYLQEDEPEAIGRAISDWHRRLKNK